jgi:transcriptional regulator with XRE-family HTH domain
MGNDIKLIRERFDLSQAELAKLLGVSQPRIARLEKQDTVTLEVLRKIAKALGVSVKDIVENGD